MRKALLALLILAAGAAYAHWSRWIELPFSSLPRQEAATASPGRGGARGPQPPIPVIATRARREDVPVTADAVGAVQPLNSVLVRAQVEGRLLEIAFREGEEVKAGDVLARIDPRSYQALYDQTVAKKAQDEAQLANAKLDLDRYARLAKSSFGSQQQADTQAAMVAQLKAQVQLAQANVDNARVTLDYTTIRAPIDGRTGIRAVDPGAIVRASDATGVVTVTQMKPIGVIFNLPQQQLSAINAATGRGAVVAQALEPDNAGVIEAGRVEVVDNLVDQTTGTVRIKASFANDQMRLWPGQFVNVRVFVDTLAGALVVPSAAIQRGPRGAFVYVVRDDDVVKITQVTLARQDEQRAVVEGGLAAGDRVVTTGFGRLTDNARVSVQMDDEAQPAPAAAETERPQRGRGRRG
ncbi:MAG: family efflux transporter subunit [Hyphomicrobiales bacterium]|nr:family efflux transporter subunit [Hyphomicrobiales bacterium]